MSTKKRGSKWKGGDYRDLGIAWEPLFPMGEGKHARVLSGAEILLRQDYADALKGKPAGICAIMNIAKIRARERTKARGYTAKPVPPERLGRPIVDANYALRALGLGSDYWDGENTVLGLVPWAAESAAVRRGIDLQRALNSRYIRPEGALDENPDAVAEETVPNLPPLPSEPKRSSKDTRFKPGHSGNYRGRPRRPKIELPFENFLQEMGTAKIGGSDRRVTRLAALIYQLTVLAINGNAQIRRLLMLLLIDDEYARWLRRNDVEGGQVVRGKDWIVDDDPFARFLRYLGIANRRTVRRVLLQPWAVEEALARMGDGRLTAYEQERVVGSTSTPHKVCWPARGGRYSRLRRADRRKKFSDQHAPGLVRVRCW